MRLNSTIQKNFLIVGILILVSFVLKGSLASYGGPYLFHPDEPYIYKDSFKLLYAVSEGDFSLISNPYNFLLSAWYALCYPLGILFGLWESYGDFKSQILAESFNIIYCGRLFSLLVSSLASMILFRYVSKDKTQLQKILIVVLIFYNPLEWISDLWIKFDPICYLINVLVLIKLFSYKEGSVSLIKLACWLGFAFAIRMDFATYFIGFLFLSILNYFPRISIKSLLIFIAVYVISYLVFTNAVFHFVSGLFMDSHANVKLDEGFVSVFMRKMQSMKIVDFIKDMAGNAMYYIRVGALVSAPILIYDAVVLRFKVFLNKYFLLLQLFLLGVLLVFNFSAPHYFFITQICYMFFVLKEPQPQNKNKLANGVLIGGVLYFFTWSLGVFYYINYTKDTRLRSADFIYQVTKSDDYVALEGFQNIGFAPSVLECTDQLRTKREYLRTKSVGISTGLTIEEKAKLNVNQCRRIVELECENRFGSDSIAETFVNTYDVNKLYKMRVKLVAAKNDWKMEDHPFSRDFYKKIKEHASEIKVFEPIFTDPRMCIFQKECFNPGFTLYLLEY